MRTLASFATITDEADDGNAWATDRRVAMRGAVKALQMKNRFNAPDFVAGAIIAACGAFFLIAARGLAFGSTRAMGPGYFPTLLSYLMLGLGLLICATACVAARETFPKVELRPMAFVLAALALFAAMIQPLGLVASVCGAIVTASFATREQRPLEIAALATAVALSASVIFVALLKLPFSVWPG